MSPYMKAYEAGIKLAQLEWWSKVAEPVSERAYQRAINERNSGQFSEENEQFSTDMNDPNTAAFIRDIRAENDEIIRRYQAQQGSSQPEPEPAPTPQPAAAPFGPPSLTYLGKPSVSFNTQLREPVIPTLASSNPEPTDDSFDLSGRLSNLANMASNAVSDAYQGSALQRYVNEASDFASDFYQGTNPDMNMSIPQQEPSELASMPPQASSELRSMPPQAAQPQAAQPQEDDVERFEREQRERAMNTFNVQRGGYGRQLARFRQQFGEGNEDLFQGDNAINYKDFARAMDNRGLQVGDTFDARNVLQNLRAMRSNLGPVANPTPTSRVGVQRRGRDIGNFQTLQQQRAAANRARPSQGANMPKARPGQFDPELKSPMLAPAIAPQLTLGSNGPGIGTGGFYNPQSAAKSSPTGLNISTDFRLNTPKQARPFNQYED